MIKILFCWASWCEPAQQQIPILKQLESEFKNVAIEKLDMDNAVHKKYAESIEVRTLPTLIFLKEGQELWRENHGKVITIEHLRQLISDFDKTVIHTHFNR